MGENPNVKDVEGNFPLWAGVVALVFLIYALKRFKDVSWKEQEVFEYKDVDNDKDNFHDWIAKNS